MNNQPSSTVRWRESRHGFACFCLLTLIVGWTALRAGLLLRFNTQPLAGRDLAELFLTGLHRDIFAGLLHVLPLLAWFIIIRSRWFGAAWHRRLFFGGLFLVTGVQIFLFAVEFFFFDEFHSRFNTVAVDYLIYPHEVFINIWDSYPVGKILIGVGLLALAWVWLANRLFRGMWLADASLRARWAWLLAALGLVAALAPTVNLKGVNFSPDRTLNEIANNGAISFAAAAWTRHLDYAAFYKTVPLDQAYARVRAKLAGPGVEFATETNTIRRRIAGDAARPKLNVILILEESLGSEFWGSLGRQKATLTPEMDKLATTEGLLFTNLYASGNRTVRGMEGVLSSFPPLPGDSIVKRDRSDNVESLARILKRDGYSTLFLYGGRGIFDGMRSYAVRNGYERFIEQKDFPKPTFTTIWGVCDEDLFTRTIEEARAMHQTGKPFFATALTVSNHKPYTYPPGRIPEDPNKRKRAHAVKYSDYALGEFFKAAKREPFWTNTIFVVVADHGARVYGSMSIPIHSYEIPLVIAGPAVVSAPARTGALGCSLDVAPTILGLIGRPYETMFFGRDLLNAPAAEGRVLVNHNRDIGLLTGERFAVLGLRHTLELLGGHPKAGDMKPVPAPGSAEKELELDATAFFQVADDLYVHERYRIDP